MLDLRLEKFALIGGHPALDFINTVSGRTVVPGSKDLREYVILADKFTDPVDLISWGRKVGFLTEHETLEILQAAENDPEEAKKVLKKAVVLREILYRLFKAAMEKWQPDPKDLANFNSELLTARKHERLNHKGGEYAWIWSDVSLAALLWMVTRSAADLLTSNALSKVGQCGGPECRWLFLDESRRHNRQWCDMRDCGNVAKVRRFRTRKATV
jgi:predicted RNA-binding Zn ribbon-like protein